MPDLLHMSPRRSRPSDVKRSTALRDITAAKHARAFAAVMCSGEEWRAVEEWPLYRVSNKGRVFGYGTLVRPRVDRRGYLAINVRNDQRRTSKAIHRLVAEVFIGPCPSGHEVNHKDGVKTNNELDNLEYVTRQQNVQHAVRNGLHRAARGEQAGNVKLTEREVLEIRSRYAAGETVTQLSRAYCRPDSTIGSVVHRKHWRHI